MSKRVEHMQLANLILSCVNDTSRLQRSGRSPSLFANHVCGNATLLNDSTFIKPDEEVRILDRF